MGTEATIASGVPFAVESPGEPQEAVVMDFPRRSAWPYPFNAGATED